MRSSQGGLDQRHFSRRSTFCPQGERKTMAVCNAHDLGALAPLGFPNLSPPFLAGTKVRPQSILSNPSASVLEMLRQRQEQVFHHAGLDPVWKTPVRRLVRAVSRWQVLPGCAGA